jgi:hypothetical protein
MSTVEVKQRSKPGSSTPSLAPATRPDPIVTWAERAECTCPELCDRDHEQD